MPLLFPTQGTLHEYFASSSPLRQKSSSQQPSATQQRPLFPAWSAVDDVKGKAEQLANKASADYTKASAATQAKAGTIELYSSKYYAACVIGGMLACVLRSHLLLDAKSD